MRRTLKRKGVTSFLSYGLKDRLVVYKRYRLSRIRHQPFKETERAKQRRKERKWFVRESQPIGEYDHMVMMLGDRWYNW